MILSLFTATLPESHLGRSDTKDRTVELSRNIRTFGGTVVEEWRDLGFVKCRLTEGAKLSLEAMGITISEDIPNSGDALMTKMSH